MWKVVFSVLVVVLAVGLGSCGLVGGPRDMDLNNTRFRNALSFAVDHHNRRSNDMYLADVTEVVRVQSQVVAGIKYFITVKMGRTTCRKQATNEHCPLSSDPAEPPPFTCVFTVWEKPWMNFLEVLKEECN